MLRARNLITRFGATLNRKMADKKGGSEIVAVVVLILIVLVIGAVIWGPAIFDFFSDFIIPGMKEKTEAIFDFTP